MKKLFYLVLGLTLFLDLDAQIIDQQLDSLAQKDYLEYAKRAKENGFVVMSKENWFKQMANQYDPKLVFSNAPGMHLIKAKNQILGGLALQLISTTGIIINTVVNYDGPTYKAINAGLGGLSFVGFVLQISGVVQIGKAGISLNENGIGIKVKF